MNHLDIHGYYSYLHQGGDNYYGGFSYQFYKSKYLDLSTAVGVRKYRKISTTHLFLPQFLFTVKLSDRVSVGGSLVKIKEEKRKEKRKNGKYWDGEGCVFNG
jgi:hypothetical protein